MFKYFRILEDQRERHFILDNCFRHLDDLGKTQSRRIYLGPGRDGSSDDKIPVNCKFHSRSTRITYNKTWPSQGYVRSSFALEAEGSEWQLVEDQVRLDDVTTLKNKTNHWALSGFLT